MSAQRTLLFAALLACTFVGHAQGPARDATTGKYTYDAIVPMDSTSSNLLFQRGAYWFEQQYKTQQLNVHDAEHGMLAHTGSFPVSYVYMNYTTENQILYTVTIAVRDGRYRYTFSDFMVAQNAAGTTQTVTLEGECDRQMPFAKKLSHRVCDEFLQQVDARIRTIVADMQVVMSGGTPAKDTW